MAVETYQYDQISIHALREEGDFRRPSQCHLPTYFYPRPPRGGRRRCRCRPVRPTAISIHALREEGDKLVLPIIYTSSNFYPRPPRGGRRYQKAPSAASMRFLSTPSARRATLFPFAPPHPGGFLSTPSARRATAVDAVVHLLVIISIHALREEGDQGC